MIGSSSDTAVLLARCEALQREQAELARFALIGQAFLGLAHELNNALNSMMLQTSVVQLRVDEQTRQELAVVRQHGAEAANLVRTLQQVVQERRDKSYYVDLNSVLTEVLEEQAELHRRIVVRLSAIAPRVHSTRSAVKQLVCLLLEGVCAGTQAKVQATTVAEDGGAVLSLTIADAPTPPSPKLGEGGMEAAGALLWQNLDEVGRLAGQSLLRQLGGVLTIEQTGGAWDLRIAWRQT